MNNTALVIAADDARKGRIVDNLSATGLFEHIKPLSSPAALFRHLKSDQVDMVCWAVEEDIPSATWLDKLQANEYWHDLPVIAFAEDQQSLLKGFLLGASDSVHVEINQHELNARINRHLQHWQKLLDLRKSQEQLQKMALTDPLTNLANRAAFDLNIKQVAARSQRSGVPYSLLLIDLDHFKSINDTFGHPTGDQVLRQAAEAIRQSSRDSDICCRYGGEEFVVILPDTNARNAEVLATRIHRKLAKQMLPEQIQVSVSIGISSSNHHNGGHPAALVEEADQAMYRAKEKGRNRTEIWRIDILNPKVQMAFSSSPRLAFGA